MRTLLQKVHSKASWHIDHFPFVVSDEVIFATIGNAYTSTGLLVDRSNVKSTIQAPMSDIDAKIKISGDKHTISQAAGKLESGPIQKSLLVLMNLRIATKDDITRELEWLLQDRDSVCRLHKMCKWVVNVVAVDSTLLETFLGASAALLNEELDMDINASVSSQRFNKFQFISQFVERMKNFDLVLLKDSDVRLSGFPWRTFIERRRNAVISGPLRQSFRESMVNNNQHRSHQ